MRNEDFAKTTPEQRAAARALYDARGGRRWPTQGPNVHTQPCASCGEPVYWVKLLPDKVAAGKNQPRWQVVDEDGRPHYLSCTNFEGSYGTPEV